MAEYDPKILREFSDRLYSEARSTIVAYSLVGLLIGAILGAIVGAAMAQGARGAETGPVVLWVAVFAGLIGLAFGIAVGMRKAFWLKLEAQRTLCQLQVEKNTRGATETRINDGKAAS